MTTWNEETLEQLRGATLVAAGEDVGSVEEVYAHAGEDRPAIARVSTAGGSVLVPLTSGEAEADRIEVEFDPELIKAAPTAQGDELAADEFEAVYAHYDIADATLRDQSHP